MRTGIRRMRVLAILAMTLTLGCASTGSAGKRMQLYAGPKLEASRVSVISSWASNPLFKLSKIHSYLIAVDGKALEKTPSVEVMPGPHMVEVGFAYEDPASSGGWHCPHPLAFSTKPGQVCEIKVHLAGDPGDKERKLYFWAEDVANGEVLSGTKPAK